MKCAMGRARPGTDIFGITLSSKDTTPNWLSGALTIQSTNAKD